MQNKKKVVNSVLSTGNFPDPFASPEEKGFITKFMDKLFRESHPAMGKLKKGDGKPVDYESEAMQSANF